MASGMKPFAKLSICLLLGNMLVGTEAPAMERRPASPRPVSTFNLPANLKPVEIAINVNRQLKSTDGNMLLYLRSGVWKPGGSLLIRDQHYFTSFEGVQKGTKLRLNSF